MFFFETCCHAQAFTNLRRYLFLYNVLTIAITHRQPALYTSGFQTFLTTDHFSSGTVGGPRTCYRKIYYIYKIPKFLCTPIFTESLSCLTKATLPCNALTYVCKFENCLKLLKIVQTMTFFGNPLADPLGTRRGPPFGPRTPV